MNESQLLVLLNEKKYNRVLLELVHWKGTLSRDAIFEIATEIKNGIQTKDNGFTDDDNFYLALVAICKTNQYISSLLITGVSNKNANSRVLNRIICVASYLSKVNLIAKLQTELGLEAAFWFIFRFFEHRELRRTMQVNKTLNSYGRIFLERNESLFTVCNSSKRFIVPPSPGKKTIISSLIRSAFESPFQQAMKVIYEGNDVQIQKLAESDVFKYFIIPRENDVSPIQDIVNRRRLDYLNLLYPFIEKHYKRNHESILCQGPTPKSKYSLLQWAAFCNQAKVVTVSIAALLEHGKIKDLEDGLHSVLEISALQNYQPMVELILQRTMNCLSDDKSKLIGKVLLKICNLAIEVNRPEIFEILIINFRKRFKLQTLNMLMTEELHKLLGKSIQANNENFVITILDVFKERSGLLTMHISSEFRPLFQALLLNPLNEYTIVALLKAGAFNVGKNIEEIYDCLTKVKAYPDEFIYLKNLLELHLELTLNYLGFIHFLGEVQATSSLDNSPEKSSFTNKDKEMARQLVDDNRINILSLPIYERDVALQSLISRIVLINTRSEFSNHFKEELNKFGDRLKNRSSKLPKNNAELQTMLVTSHEHTKYLWLCLRAQR